MIFAHPEMLALAAVVPVAGAWLYRRTEAMRRQALEALGDAPVLERAGLWSGVRGRAWRTGLRLAALTLACVALARPQGDAEDTRTGRSGRDVLVALDLSRSMLVQDADGTRLERARTLARQASAELRADRFGLVIFGGAAFLQLPLTRDHTVFDRFLEATSPNAIDDPGTDLNAALDVARTTFEHEGGDGHRAVLLLSDGERSEGAIDDAIARLVGANIPVFAIGVGTASGGFVPADPSSQADSGSRWHLDNIGRAVTSRLDPDVLQRLAEQTGGRYAAWDDATARAALLAAIRRISARPLGTQRVAQHVELFQWPLGLAALLLVLEALLALASRPHALTPSRPTRPRGVQARRPGVQASSHSPPAARIALLAIVSLQAGCSADHRAYSAARRAYASSEYPESFDLYSGRLAGARDPLIQLGAGNAAYRVSRFEDAAASYRRALDAPRSVGNRVRFNLGNAWFRAAQATKEREGEFFDLAIQAYEQALRIDPSDADARWNLELALRKRGETETGGSPGRGGRAIAGEGEGSEEGLDSDREQAIGAMAGGGSGDAQGESAEELSEDEARRLLETVEKEQLTAHEGRPGRRGGRAERDW